MYLNRFQWLSPLDLRCTVFPLVDGQRPLQQLLLLADVAQPVVGVAQIRQRRGHVAVIRAELPLLYHETPLRSLIYS